MFGRRKAREDALVALIEQRAREADVSTRRQVFAKFETERARLAQALEELARKDRELQAGLARLARVERRMDDFERALGSGLGLSIAYLPPTSHDQPK